MSAYNERALARKGKMGDKRGMDNTSTIKKKKLCWNCEGDVARSTANCPYCGVYLHPEEEPESENPPVPEDAYTPPYNLDESPEEDAVIPQAPYPTHEEPSPMQETPIASALPKNYEGWKQIVIPLSLLMAGSVFFLFSFLMLLFSQNGYFSLRWDASYWFVYLLVALPLLYFGWQSLETLED